MDSFHCSPRIVSTPSEPSSTVISPGYRDTEKNSTLRDEAKLLLSIADIAKCEIAVCPFALLSEDDSYSSGRSSRSVCCPTFPVLHKGGDHNRGDTETSTATDSFLAPRLESLRGLLHSSIMSDFKPLPGRLRAVSIDTPSLFLLDRLQKNEDMPSPLAAPPTLASVLIESSFAPLEKAGRLRHSSRSGSKRTTPTSMSHTSAVPRSMLSHKARRERFLEVKQKTCHTRPATSASSSPMTVSSIPVTPPPARKSSSKSLQGKPGEGVPTKKIFRRKFSWKNYPEVRIDVVCLLRSSTRKPICRLTLFVLSIIFPFRFDSWNVSWLPTERHTFVIRRSITLFNRSSTTIVSRTTCLCWRPSMDTCLTRKSLVL